MKSAGAVGRAWLLCLVPPLVWFAHFSGLYGIASFGRAADMTSQSFYLSTLALTIVACIAVTLAWRFLRPSAGLGAQSPGTTKGAQAVGRTLALLSLAGILFQGLVLSIIPY